MKRSSVEGGGAMKIGRGRPGSDEEDGVSLLAYSFVCFIYFFIKSKLNYSLQISAV
jgi:hypothetical protein